MHWSPVWLSCRLPMIIFLLSPLIGQPAAEMVAGTLVPLLGLGLVAYLIGQDNHPFGHPRSRAGRRANHAYLPCPADAVPARCGLTIMAGRS